MKDRSFDFLPGPSEPAIGTVVPFDMVSISDSLSGVNNFFVNGQRKSQAFDLAVWIFRM